jgi:hypothetical protein
MILGLVCRSLNISTISLAPYLHAPPRTANPPHNLIGPGIPAYLDGEAAIFTNLQNLFRSS